MDCEYPIYKKHVQLSDGSEVNGTIYMEFNELHKAKCLKIDGKRPAYEVGRVDGTATHTSNLWEPWDGNIDIQLQKFKMEV